MKTLKYQLFIWSVILIIGCKYEGANAISGVYVSSFKNEYSIASDTLIIDAYNLAARTYKIEKRSAYNQIWDGKVLPKTYKHQKWMATFDESKQALQETAFGRQIFFESNHQSLFYNGRYQRSGSVNKQ